MPDHNEYFNLLPSNKKEMTEVEKNKDNDGVKHQLPEIDRNKKTQKVTVLSESQITSKDLGYKSSISYTAQELMEMHRANIIERRRKKRNKGWSKTVDMDAIEKLNTENKKPSVKDYSEHEMPKDVSTFPVDLTRTITADRYIDCAIKEQINSQVEGSVTCQVVNDVFGSHGRKILIPAGSSVKGFHGSLSKVGDERFEIAWKRIIRPDGAQIKLTEASASDRSGQNGLGGMVNNRNWDKYGGALLTSTVSVLAQMSIPVKQGAITNSVIQNYGTDLGQVTAAMLNSGLNIKPYSIVPAGRIIKITPSTDIWLKHFEDDSFELVSVKNN